MGIMVDRHAAVQLCLEIVQLKGLLDSDRKVLLDIELNAKGREWQPVMRLVRQIMAQKRVMGIKLWQCIAMLHDDIYEGLYANDKGCRQHKEKTNKFGGTLGAYL